MTCTDCQIAKDYKLHPVFNPACPYCGARCMRFLRRMQWPKTETRIEETRQRWARYCDMDQVQRLVEAEAFPVAPSEHPIQTKRR